MRALPPRVGVGIAIGFATGIAIGLGGLLTGCGLSGSGLGDIDAGAASGGTSVAGRGGPGTGGVGSGGRPSTGGQVGSGGAPGSGGSDGTVSSGGTVGSGGAVGSGGTVGSGGRFGSGGTIASGGRVGSGGAVASGGAVGSGGTVGSGGSVGSGGAGTGGRGTGGAIGSGGRPGTGGSASGGRAGAGGGGANGTGGTNTGGSGGPCTLACLSGRTCCGNSCVNTQNDPFNCGGCGRQCAGQKSHCASGTCQQPPCTGTRQCGQSSTCCGTSCCQEGELCCENSGAVVSDLPSCHQPTAAEPTCPVGCAPLCVSDRNLKKQINAIDPQEILAKVSRLPISTWSYVNEPVGVRHLGPMAQDFYASFGLGDSDRSYHSVDGHGVALAAIQALDRLVEAERERIKALEIENRALTTRIDALEKTAGARSARPR